MSDTASAHSPDPQPPPPLPTPLPSMAKQAALKQERRRADEETTRATLGRTVARFKQMYGNSKIALMQALDSSESDQEERRRNPSAPLPSMIGEALEMRNPAKELNKLASDIDVGWSEARNTDTASLKKGIAANFHLEADYDEFGHWTPALNPTNKRKWGPKHPQLLPLVVPVRDPPLDDDELEMLKQAGSIVSCTKWYDWMWKGRKHDPKNLDEGFLRGDLLVKAYLWVYFGSVITPMPTRLAAARKVGFTSVTIHSIAYAATLLRFALSREARIDEGFNSAGFYQYLVQYLEHEDQRELTLELLRWWNRHVFPAGVAGNVAPEPITDGTWELAIRQRAQRKAAAAARQREQGGSTVPGAATSTPSPPPISPLNDATNASTAPSHPNASSHSAIGFSSLVNQDGDDGDGDSGSELPPARPAKKARYRIEESENETDIDGEEVREEVGPVLAAPVKPKKRQGGKASKAVGTAG
ncbi:hypothetical protein FRC04_009250, partial [Tulasnella sp. 424]